MNHVNDLLNELNSDDWQEAFKAVRRYMVEAIEHPPNTHKSPEYYEELANKLHKVWFEVHKKEKGYY